MLDQHVLEDQEEITHFREAWSEVISDLEGEVSRAVMERFLRPLEPIRLDGSIATIAAPSAFISEWVRDKFLQRLQIALSERLRDLITITLIMKPGVQSEGKVAQPSFSFTAPASSPDPTHLYTPERFLPNDRYKFDTFIVGQSNRLAFAGAKAVADEPGTKYNPLFIYGASGLGKTHLLHSIAQEIIAREPNYPIVYISAQQFAEKFVHALQNNRIEHFRRAQRSMGVWLVDDIQFIAGKDKTQEEIFHTFNYMHSIGKQIVLCSDRPPRDLFLMDERLRSRFEAGLVADIQSPDPETRCAILLSKAKQEKIPIDHEVAMYLAETVPGNIRVLEGALIKLAAQASIDGVPLDLIFARSIVDRYYRNDQFSRPNTDQILDLVSSHYHIAVEELTGTSRKAPIAHARHVAIFLIREITKDSWKHIGSCFGDRDHTSIMHAHQKITDMMFADRNLKATIDSLMKNFAGRH